MWFSNSNIHQNYLENFWNKVFWAQTSQYLFLEHTKWHKNLWLSLVPECCWCCSPKGFFTWKALVLRGPSSSCATSQICIGESQEICSSSTRDITFMYVTAINHLTGEWRESTTQPDMLMYRFHLQNLWCRFSLQTLPWIGSTKFPERAMKLWKSGQGKTKQDCCHGGHFSY